MPLCLVCQHSKLVDAPCRTCGFCGMAEGYATFAILPSSSTLVNDARALAAMTVKNILIEQDTTYEIVSVH